MTLVLGLSGALLLGLALFTRIAWSRIASANPPRGRLVPVAGGALHVLDAGPADAARTILLLHGASGNLADMASALAGPLVARGFRVLAFDRPGHGWSDRPGGRRDCAPARQAELIGEALARLGVGRAIVVGHSLGGAYACALAIGHPALVEGLVLIAPVTHPWPGGVAWYYRLAAPPVVSRLFTETLTLPLGLLLMNRAIAGVFSPQTPTAGHAGRTRARLALRPSAFRANAGDVRNMKRFLFAQAPRMPEIVAPTAIVTGDRDGVVLAHIHARGAARDIPGARLTILPGVGHAPHHVAGEAIVAAILETAERARAGRRAPA